MDTSIMDGFAALDGKRRELLKEQEGLQAERNRANDEITAMKKKKESPDALIASLKDLSARIKALDPKIAEVEEEEKSLLSVIPNLVHESVPEGGEADSQEIRRVGDDLKDMPYKAYHHWELGLMLNMMDFPRATKIAGSRFVALFGNLAKMNRALISYMLDLHTQKHGYVECWPPAIVNSTSLFGTGQLPKFQEDLFKLENHDLYLIPTAEVPVTNLYRDEVIEDELLPISICAYTPCFRAEAGAAGKDTKGMIRMHQFDKVELVKFARPEDSMHALEKLTADAEDVLKGLNLPYRTVVLAGGDLGFSSTKTYDLEVWLPGSQVYREISSCSCFTDFQARRANIRFRKKGGKSEYVHTLNGSGLAVGRTLAAIMENYQDHDQTIVVPQVLRPYMGVDRIWANVTKE
jgi:seryl-tRNA synthetase